MRIKVGSLQPPQVIELLEDGVKIVGLDTATSVIMRAEFAGDLTFIEDTSPAIDAGAGTVTHHWQAGQTDEAGRLFWLVGVDFGSGVTWFPSQGDAGVTDIE